MEHRPALWKALSISLLLVLVSASACDDGGASAPSTEGREPTSPASPAAPPTPSVPPLDSLDAPAEGRSNVALPEWDAARSRWDHPVRSLRARLGTSEDVVQVQLGESPSTGVVVTFYGAGLAAGSYDVKPATDETRAQHAGRDDDVFVVTVGTTGGDLRSESGTVAITHATRERVAGSLDVSLRSRTSPEPTLVRAKFDAAPDPWLQAELEHQAAIRDQLRERARGR